MGVSTSSPAVTKPRSLPGKKLRAGGPPPHAGACDLLGGLTREADWGYGPEWHADVSQRSGISIETYLAHSDMWQCSPTLRRYREVGRRNTQQVGEAFGRRVRADLEGAESAVVCVEKPYLDGFIDGFGVVGCPPLVLLAVNGGDEPFNQEQQNRVACLDNLRACFVNNLIQPVNSSLFHPLPIGLSGEEHIGRVVQSALPWRQRDHRLLIAPMRMTSRLRKQYIEVLSRPEYSTLVCIIQRRVEHEEFLHLLSQHQSVLSPPGRGYDCGRTWQAVAVGTVPLVVEDPAFDQRLHVGVGPEFLPSPEMLTPASLEIVLSELRDPAEHAEHLDVRYWKARWESHLR
mmetsp:Transcript_73697/g.216274  ORF Transcript_73697/g.216274 Transcript_73697/m.216274 type:complete len:345 (+) Transcript_73697:233-1267(+)